jgi:hypothetical protein
MAGTLARQTNTQVSNQSASKKVVDIRDIRDAKSAAEVRQIMNDVKSRYKQPQQHSNTKQRA